MLLVGVFAAVWLGLVAPAGAPAATLSLARPGAGVQLSLRDAPAPLRPEQPWLHDVDVLLGALELAPLTLSPAAARDGHTLDTAARALRAYGNGDWRGAAILLSVALDADEAGARPALAPGDHAELLRWRGLALARAGNLAAARADLDQAIVLAPEGEARALAYAARGLAAILDGNPIRAAADYGEALGLGLRWPEVYFARGLVLQLTDNDTQAVRDYSDALRLRPEFGRALTRRGIAAFYAGDFAAAVADFDAALRADPDDVEAYDFRADAHRERGDLARAIADYEQVALRRPDYAETFTMRGWAYARQGDLDRAQRDLDRAIALQARAFLRQSLREASELRLAQAAASFRQFLTWRENPQLRAETERAWRGLGPP
jgi:tetratricopeptide (TPR) repeat protein